MKKLFENHSRLDAYRQLVQTLLDGGYRTIPFTADPPPSSALLLRHDIDFDVLLARETAQVEEELGVMATYFFMLRSASYNLLEPSHGKILEEIREMGHEISLHFDPTIYDDFTAGLHEELEVFRCMFGLDPRCISIHRPNDYFLTYDGPIGDIRHTYQSLYQKRVVYFSDSQGSFRYGSPVESQAFEEGRSIHLLTHPVWWATDETDPVKVLDAFLDERVFRFRRHMAANCKPYRSVVE